MVGGMTGEVGGMTGMTRAATLALVSPGGILHDFTFGDTTMSRKREPMRKIKEVLRLAELEALSVRQIARASHMKRTTVRDYLSRARVAGLRWPAAKEMDDDSIEKLLFPSGNAAATTKAVPDWSLVHTEHKRPHVTLHLLWEEYRAQHPLR